MKTFVDRISLLESRNHEEVFSEGEEYLKPNPNSVPNLETSSPNHFDDSTQEILNLDKVTFHKWYVGIKIVINQDFIFEGIALFDSGADLNCIREGDLLNQEFLLRIDCKAAKDVLEKDVKNIASKDIFARWSYHDWEHYNSVRLNEDTCIGPARPVIIKADADLSANSNQGKVAVTKSKGGVGHNIVKAESIRMVIVGSGCENVEKVEKVLLELGGDVGATIEYLIADQGTEEYLVEIEEVNCSSESTHVAIQKESIEQLEEECKEIKYEQEPSCRHIDRTHANSDLQNDEKKISRNKACPCGSKKKYKSCCGTVSGRSSARVAVGNAPMEAAMIKQPRPRLVSPIPPKEAESSQQDTRS
ncbi:hypothetical protein RJ640_030474 [Escallonia rubra]|uniref:Uncharacterized protein n=1 Tax=Escallonia rubra TaxID=112253 RepID=A0AA88U0N7_9ASTE|nr:hypothetical protein RJ640_030474 [Escallonia rubra]